MSLKPLRGLLLIPLLLLGGCNLVLLDPSGDVARQQSDIMIITTIIIALIIVPVLVVIAVGAVSWLGTHQTDPYRALDRIAPGKPVPADVKPLEVDVISLRWKWLFLYPQYGIATVNEM